MARIPTCGIYRITMANGRCYIGQSVDIMKRWSHHRGMLRRGAHHSEHLQRAWIKYGEESFSLEVLEICAKDKTVLTQCEQRWMDKLKPVFNSAPAAQSGLGRIASPETRAKMSAARKGRKHWWGSKISAAKMGHEVSEETRKLLSDQRKGIPTGRKLSPESRQRMREAALRREARRRQQKAQEGLDGNGTLPDEAA